MDIDLLLADGSLLRNAVASATLIVALLLLRAAALRWIRKSVRAADSEPLRWAVQVRWTVMLLLTLGLVLIWAAELRAVAISVVAIAAAIVIATKELIMCLGGSMLRTTSGSFSIGDRVEIAGVRGDVVDLRPLTTTILETGPGHRRTGRAVVIPNALLLTSPVINETFTEDYVVHPITVPIHASRHWKHAENVLLKAAQEVSSPFLAEAKRHMSRATTRHGLPPFTIDPAVRIQIPEAGKLHLILRVPTPARRKGETEQEILRRFLEVFSPDSSPKSTTDAEARQPPP